jgi:galactokinase
VPLSTEDVSFVLCNTNVPRQLVGSEYNKRRSECEEAVRIIAQHKNDVRALRDITPEMLAQYGSELPNTVYVRAQHVVEENKRVIRCIDILNSGNIHRAASLLNESHASLRDLYEVSCRELDIMAEIAWDTDGVLGARMMGGGFGGCTINIVEKQSVDAFAERIQKEYPEKTGYQPDIFICSASNGVREIDL